MNVHEWRDESADGERRQVRARRHGGRWILEARLASEDGWTTLDPPPLEDLLFLRDVLWRKYQRGRVPHEHVLQLDALIEARGED